MPKSTIQVLKVTRNGNVKTNVRLSRKFKLGGRKAAVSAIMMSSDELIEKYEGSNKKSRGKIIAVLSSRGIDLKAILAEREAAAKEAADAEAEVTETAEAEVTETAEA